MSFEVDVTKTLRSAARAFTLHMRFRTHGRRTVIHGPSGAGKSLTLQALAGLLRPDAGRIAFDGEPLFDADARLDVPACRRRFGYVFQDYALFPQLTVRQNVAFGLHRGLLNPGRRGGGEAVDRWLRSFELEAVAAQRPAELSGGQRQRTALARALVNRPRALLLDEPFAALDPGLRERMRTELDALLHRVDVPVLLITHDPADLAWFGHQTLRVRDGMVVEDEVERSSDQAAPADGRRD